MNKLSRILSLAVLLAAIGGLGACNTVDGAGKDIERAGEKIQEEVDESR